VRSFTGAPEAEKAKPAEPGAEDEEFVRAPAPRVGVKAGMNRFTWDMRYPGPVEIPKMILWAAGRQGPRAVPGRYQAVLTVTPATAARPEAGSPAAVTERAAFAVRRHPWLTGISAEDFQEQFRVAMEIRDRVSEANEAVNHIRSIKGQINDRLSKALGSDFVAPAADAPGGIGAVSKPQKGRQARIAEAGLTLLKTLTDIEGEIYQYRNQSSQDPLNYPIKLNNKLAALLGVVESADGRPTDQAYEALEELSRRLQAELARVAAIEKTDLPAFHALAGR